MSIAYGYGRKKLYRRKGEKSLALLCLADGTLDVDLQTGEVFGARGQVRKPWVDADGYLCLSIHRDVTRGGRVVRESGKRRRRKRMTVGVHRLVAMKKAAVDLARLNARRLRQRQRGGEWRALLRGLPGTCDVDHIDRDRQNNRASNLGLSAISANRGRRPMTAEELAAVNEFLNAS